MPAGGGNQPAEAGAAIKYGWEKFKENFGEIIVALIIGFVIIVVFEIIGYLIYNSLVSTDTVKCNITQNNLSCSGGGPSFFVRLIAQGILQAVFFVASAALQLFVIRATLMIINGEKLEMSRVLSLENLGPYVIAVLIVGVMAFIGFIACILPGIAVLFLTHFYGYFVIDKKMAPMEAIKASYELIKANAGVMFVFYLLTLVVIIAGVIACGVGLIVAWPVVIIATGYMYKRLQGEPVAA